MDTLKNDLLAAIRDLETAVAAMPTHSVKPDLRPLFQRIEDLAARLPADIDPTLRHYLHKKSYQKARLWLEDRDAENQVGHCRHV